MFRESISASTLSQTPASALRALKNLTHINKPSDFSAKSCHGSRDSERQMHFFQSKFSLFRNARATLGLFDGRVDGGNFVFPRDLACICSKVGVISLSACDDFIKLPNLGLKKSRKIGGQLSLESQG